MPPPADCRAGNGLGRPSIFARRKQLQSLGEFAPGALGGVDVIAVGLVDGEQVGHLDDSAFDSLEFVTGAGDHEQEKKIDHAVNQRLRLAHAHGFNEDGVKARGLAEDHGLARATGNAAERAARGRRAYERHLAVGKPLHAGFVAEDAAAGALAAGIDGEDRDAVPLADQVIPQRLNERALARSGDAGDADANGVARARQTGVDDLLSQFGVFAARAFDQRNGAGQRDAVAAKDAFNIFRQPQAAATAHTRELYFLGLLDAGPNKKSFIPMGQRNTPFAVSRPEVPKLSEVSF